MGKILHISGNLKIGGVSTFIKSLTELNSLYKTQHDLAFIRPEIDSFLHNTKIIKLNNLHRNPFKFWFKVREIIENYDAICFHNMHYLIVPYFFFYRKKYFLFQHGMTVSTGNFLKREIKKIWYSLIPILLNARVICSTEFAYNKIINSGIKISRKRIRIIPFGIKLNETPLPQKIKNNNSLIIGSAGILSRIKRFNLLIESLIDYNGDRKIEVQLAGDGFERERLEKIANKVNSQKVYIKFLGAVHNMEEFYKGLDLFVFPSHDESFGLVVLEALHNNVPVVCFSDLGGALSYVKHGYNGIILNNGIGELKKFWVDINNQPAILDELRKNVSNTNSELFDINVTRKQLEELFKNGSEDLRGQKSDYHFDFKAVSERTIEPLKVLHFIGQGTVGGQERAQYQLFKGLVNSDNIDLGVAIVRDRGIYIPKIKSLNIPLIFLNIKGGFDFSFKKEIIGKMRNYQVHHLHDPSPNIIIYSLLAGKKIKRVFTRRGGIADYGFNIKKQLKFILKRFLLKKFIDGYSGNSINAIRSVQTQYGVSDKKVFPLYNGIYFEDLNPYKAAEAIRSELGFGIDEFIVGTTGRLVGLKRVDLIIRAFSKVNIKSQKLLIIGNGPERHSLEKLSAELGLKDKVIFPGIKTDIGNYLQVMNTFVLASGKEESFGNSVVEAMYFKIPSIVMQDSLGLLEHITKNETGFIADDEADMTSILEYIYHNPDAARCIGEKAHNHVIKKYSIENMVKAYKDFYLDVLNSPS